MIKKTLANDIGANQSDRSNWLKAAVLGSNDGIISIAGLVIGVSGAALNKEAVLSSGIAGIIAGAISLGAGEFVSIKAERDMEDALLDKEKKELQAHPKEELEDLVEVYTEEGLKPKIAKTVARELTEADAFDVHAEVDYNINPKHLARPLSSVIASSVSFVLGAMIPLLGIMLFDVKYAIAATFISVVIALMITGFLTAKVSGGNVTRSMIRVVIGGAVAMTVTYAAGVLFNAAV